MSGPRVAIGVPVYNRADHVRSALESLLAQSHRELALVVVDDRSTDATAQIARELAARDPRLEVIVNERRLGMRENTNRALELALARAELCALGSDHDRWHPDWLATLVALLEANPRAVLAYPQSRRIDEHGRPYPRAKPPWRFDTRGVADPRARMRRAFRGMVAGDMIYGLFRASALREVGGYRPVLVPDRLLLSELALRGEFVQAGEVLWERRFRGLADLDRQRRAFWLERAPWWTHLPWWLTHVALVARDHGAGIALDYLEVSVRHRAWRRARRARHRAVRARDAALGPPVRAALRRPAVRRFVRRHALPALRESEEALDRLTRRENGGAT